MRALATFLLLCTASPAAAQYDRLQSNEPLFTHDDEIWPRNYADEDSFGCVTTVLTGTWRLDHPTGETEWVRISLEGAFHCLQRYTAFDPSDEVPASLRGGGQMVIFAPIAEVEGGELWIMQSGWAESIVRRPESPPIGYQLLLRPDPQPAQLTFHLLPIDCAAMPGAEAAAATTGPSMACNVPDKEALRALALAMAGREPTGSLVFTGR